MNPLVNLFWNQQKVSYFIVLSIPIHMVNLIEGSVPLYSEGSLVNSFIVHHNKICPLLGIRTIPYKGQQQNGCMCLVANGVEPFAFGFLSDFDAK